MYALVEQLLVGYSIVSLPASNNYVYRLRVNEDINDFSIVQDLWFPQDDHQSRLNWLNHPVLYCSSSKDICFQEKDIKDQAIVSICKFKILNSKIQSIFMGFRDKSYFISNGKRIKWGDYRRERLIKAGKNPEDNKIIDEFLFDVFIEPTDKYYIISASLARFYLYNRSKSLDAIVYPSVKRNGKGPVFNWAFSANFAMNNMVPVCFCKYRIDQSEKILLATAQYKQDKLILDMEIDWHNT